MYKFINLWQTPEERKDKYHLALALGCSISWARKMRDWRLSKIERLFGLVFPERFRNAPILAPYAQFLLPGFTINPQGYQQADNDAL